MPDPKSTPLYQETKNLILPTKQPATLSVPDFEKTFSTKSITFLFKSAA